MNKAVLNQQSYLLLEMQQKKWFSVWRQSDRKAYNFLYHAVSVFLVRNYAFSSTYCTAGQLYWDSSGFINFFRQCHMKYQSNKNLLPPKWLSYLSIILPGANRRQLLYSKSCRPSSTSWSAQLSFRFLSRAYVLPLITLRLWELPTQRSLMIHLQ